MNYLSLSLCLSYGASACIRGHDFARVFLGVSEQFTCYEVGLSALRPNPSNAGGPKLCFFLRFLSTNLPGMADLTAATRPPTFVTVLQPLGGEFQLSITHYDPPPDFVYRRTAGRYVLFTDER